VDAPSLGQANHGDHLMMITHTNFGVARFHEDQPPHAMAPIKVMTGLVTSSKM